MDLILFAGRLVLALVFAASGFGKLFDRSGTRQAAAAFGLPTRVARVAAWLVPLLELGIAFALLTPSSATLSGLTAAVLLGVFSVAAVRLLRQQKTAPCHCFGRLTNGFVTWRLVLRNVVLMALAVTTMMSAPSATVVAVILLALVALLTVKASALKRRPRDHLTAGDTNREEPLPMANEDWLDRGSKALAARTSRRAFLGSATGMAAAAFAPPVLWTETIFQTGSSQIARRNDPRNIRHDATCAGFGSYQAATGVYDTDGINHPHLAGATLLTVNSPHWKYDHVQTTIGWYCPCVNPPIYYTSEKACEAVPPCQPGLGGCLVKCGGNSNCVKARIVLQITGAVTISALQWEPPGSISQQCQSNIAAFNKAVNAHEAVHAQDAADILKQAANDPPGTIIACGKTVQDAKKNLPAAAGAYANARAQYYLDLYSKSIEKRHSSELGDKINLDCTGCP